MTRLEGVRSPADLRRLGPGELSGVAEEVRARIADVVGPEPEGTVPGLGLVELTIALHYVFDTPRDRVLWDVRQEGHAHKILTGRNDVFPTLGRKGGISAYPRREESEYDVFGGGHAATSISAALGMAIARDLAGEDHAVIAVMGASALTSGLTYEALNGAGASGHDLIVILNDTGIGDGSGMGAINRTLMRMVTNPIYNRVRSEVKGLLQRTPSGMEQMASRFEDSLKGMFIPGVLFEELGFRYVGPVDGHDLDALLDTLKGVGQLDGPRVVHVMTRRERGADAGEEPSGLEGSVAVADAGEATHAGDGADGQASLPDYAEVLAAALTRLGTTMEELVVVTAGIPGPGGVTGFAAAHPDRYFDVGHAHGHAVTFAAGMAAAGLRPVVVMDSTFLQRAYDAVIHDVALQKLPVVFAVGGAGMTGPDAPTHMGLYDIAYLSAVPGMTVSAPKDGAELAALLRVGLARGDGPFSVRYPNDRVPGPMPPDAELEAVAEPFPIGRWETLREGSELALLATGATVLPALEAAGRLEGEGLDPTVVNCRFIKPMDVDALDRIRAGHAALLTVEDGTITNGFGATLARVIAESAWGDAAPRTAALGAPDRIVEPATRAQQLADAGLTPEGIAARALALVADAGGRGREGA